MATTTTTTFNQLITMSTTDLDRLITTPEFLTQLALQPELGRALAVARKLVPPTADEQRVIDAATLRRSRDTAMSTAVLAMATALEDALCALDDTMAVPMSAFVKRTVFSAIVFNARRQYMWGVIMGDAAQNQVAQYNLQGHGSGNYREDEMAEDFAASPLRRAEAMAEFHQLQTEQYELMVKAAKLAWERATRAMHKEVNEASNNYGQMFVSPAAEAAQRTANMIPDDDLSDAAVEQFRRSNDQRRYQQQQQAREATQQANAVIRLGTSFLFPKKDEE